MNARAKLSLFFAILLLIATLGCGQKADPAAAASGPPPVRVKTVKATPQPVGQYIEYLSTLKSRDSAVLRPEVEGQIVAIFVRAGDRVQSGTPILEIDPRKQEATVRSQEATR